jgi:elongation factor P hydroxylase
MIHRFEKTCNNCKHRKEFEFSDVCGQAYQKLFSMARGQYTSYDSTIQSRLNEVKCGPDAVWFKPTLWYRVLRLLGIKP